MEPNAITDGVSEPIPASAVIPSIDVQKLRSEGLWGEEADACSDAPSPVWARYIDSRLEQFCER